MIVYVLFVQKKSVSKRKVCIIFNKKNIKKPLLEGFFRWVFLGGFLMPTLGPGRRDYGHARPGPRFGGRSDGLFLVGFRGRLLREAGEGEQSAVAGDQEPAAGSLLPLLRTRGDAHQRLGGHLPWRKERVFRHLWELRKRKKNLILFSGRQIDLAPMDPDPYCEWYWTNLTNKPDF